MVTMFDISTFAATPAQAAVLGDGNSKPLSGYYATLAAAQADYPAATALTDELDWAVIQKCTTAAANATVLAGGIGALAQSGATVVMSGGVYVINRRIDVNPGTSIHRGIETSFIGYGQPVLAQTSTSSDILVWSYNVSGGVLSGGNYDNLISGITFRGGRRQIAFSNNDNEGCKMSIIDCGFIASDDYAVYGAQNGVGALNTLLNFKWCRFTGCKKLLYTTSSPTKLADIWITGGDINTWSINTPNDTALIYAAANTKTFLDNFYGSPVLDEARQQRWIDMHGSAIYIDRSRFGGEGAGGVSVCWWFTAPNASNGFNPPSPTVFSITNSDTCCGTTNLSGANVGVLNLRSNVPQMMIFRGNRYYFHPPKINNGGAINFATYFASFPATYRWKLEHEPDSKWFDDNPTGGGQPPGIPIALRPYLTFGDVEGGGADSRAITLANGLNSNIAIQQTYKNLLASGPTAAFSVGGFDNVWHNREIRLIYLGTQTQTIVNEDASSTAENRIRTLTGGNVVVKGAATFLYQSAISRWVLISYN